MKKAVVLLSGGADSAATAAYAVAKGYEVFALTFDYGQRHCREIECACRLAGSLGVSRHYVIRTDLASLAESSLTGPFAVPKDRDPCAVDIPSTYVPARNLIFLSVAAAWAESLGANDIFIGVSCIDYSGYPDCRPEFLTSFEKCVNLATRAGVSGEHIRVQAPFLNKSKADVIMAGHHLGVDYSLTHSCYDPDVSGSPCGRCDSCLIRARAFRQSGLKDPIAPQ